MGGHDIPEAKVRVRYSLSRMRLIELLPSLTALKVFDNTEDGPQKGHALSPKLPLHMHRGGIVSAYDLLLMPPWAKPIVPGAIASSGRK
jgi:hypothetical protein